MRLLNKKILYKLLRKNKGNKALENAITDLIDCLEVTSINSYSELKKVRPDADKVHNDGFYFFNISIHRSLILVEISDQEATVVWAGSHAEYERTFKNNKATIKKWLLKNDWI